MKKFLIHSFLLAALLVPVAASALSLPSQLVPCDGPTGLAQGQSGKACDFQAIIQLANNIINYFIIASITISALLFGYAGFLMVTARGDTGAVTKAKGIAESVAWGFAIMLSGWLIVHFILDNLLSSSYTGSVF